jgi:hypothetical protein
MEDPKCHLNNEPDFVKEYHRFEAHYDMLVLVLVPELS